MQCLHIESIPSCWNQDSRQGYRISARYPAKWMRLEFCGLKDSCVMIDHQRWPGHFRHERSTEYVYGGLSLSLSSNLMDIRPKKQDAEPRTLLRMAGSIRSQVFAGWLERSAFVKLCWIYDTRLNERNQVFRRSRRERAAARRKSYVYIFWIKIKPMSNA